jgi:enoyl-[acyl-carrier protein] reductase III
MDIPFRSALITGSSRGIGRQIALKLAREGVERIGIHYRTGRGEAEKTLALVGAAGARGYLIRGDVGHAQVAERIVTEAASAMGGCDIFIQSVCPPLGEIYENVRATELSLEKWELAFDTQARAFFVGGRAAAKFMKGGGRIIGLSYSMGAQTGGWQPWVGMGSAKAAMESVGRYFAVALARDGVTVNMVSPGFSDATTVVGQTPQQWQDAMLQWSNAGWSPTRKQSSPETIADACALLCCREAAFITGQSISVDGGSSLMNPQFPIELQVPA